MNGDWVYDEFNSDAGVKELDIEKILSPLIEFFKGLGG
jgi:hypothetical protein